MRARWTSSQASCTPATNRQRNYYTVWKVEFFTLGSTFRRWAIRSDWIRKKLNLPLLTVILVTSLRQQPAEMTLRQDLRTHIEETGAKHKSSHLIKHKLRTNPRGNNLLENWTPDIRISRILAVYQRYNKRIPRKNRPNFNWPLRPQSIWSEIKRKRNSKYFSHFKKVRKFKLW